MANPPKGARVGQTPVHDADHEQQGGDEHALIPDERVLVRFTGPWKNYSRGDITRLSPAEAELVIKKALAQVWPEQAEE
ncbi:hypothetical protein [Aeromonas veronii]